MIRLNTIQTLFMFRLHRLGERKKILLFFHNSWVLWRQARTF